ncbi:MAG TPA: Ig-like domain-containing protein [Planctomycetota bacterium]|nr:Ig-like domain-containing protein [Planctomycetota bacterium]
MIPLTFAFSTAVSDFTAGDVVVRNGTLSGFNGSGDTYTAVLTPRKPGPVRVEIPSGAANAGGQASNSVVFTRTYDTAGPTVTINQAGGQVDPAIAGPFTFAVQFSQPVTGFTGAGVSFTGSTATGTLAANVTGSGQTYTVSVSGMVGDGTVVASLLADAGVANGHPSAASTSSDNTITFTPPGVGSPTATIDQNAGQPDPTPLSTIVFRVRFSDPVNGFSTNDVILSGTAPGTLTKTVSSISSSDYLVLVSGMSGAGTVIAALPAGAATAQAGGQPTFAATSSDNQVTYAPTGGSSSGPSAAGGSGACGLGSGLAALLASGALALLARRSLR